ncbi:Ribosomal large subunit pseudouridine synthase D [Seminavis robusta]|uniref:Ribosomal large subunit pseudouridine synthase D n=1 Tax=Seminavis robusta TaxID=568900 RepID=A0A9N8H9U2_9STRA|nr:Ribosomal large subunit pseudouridine synthase D [Seminavis robusta]|eukprot:Sro127_g060700.1 Ribosomal large subunit pseudouridine synthase D (420) ;mRNA; f:8896-10155
MKAVLIFLWRFSSLTTRGYRWSLSNKQPLASQRNGLHALSQIQGNSETPWMFDIVEDFPPPSRTDNLLHYLLSNQIFPTASRARRAIRYGEILVLSDDEEFDPHAISRPIDPPLKLSSGHSVHRVTRLPDRFYPVQITKYLYPPETTLLQNHEDWVVFQDDEMAVVHKPEGMTTIESTTTGTREDLQSLLPFILTPPTRTSKETVAVQRPRPIHRLDRGTSGLVLVGKTQSTLARLSALFANRQVHKTYTAVVFGHPRDGDDDDGGVSQKHTKKSSGVVDYPIDCKAAATKWRVLETNDRFSMVELNPETGRYHQLRRHLAYCLRAPIVGDPKYDLVGTGGSSNIVEEHKSYRRLGLHLCCHQLEFDHTFAATSLASHSSGPKYSYTISEATDDNQAGTKRMRVSLTSLPDKFFKLFQT